MSRSKLTGRQDYRPAARTNELSITQVGDETVVYDQLTHDASCLNAVTTAVWNACDGENDINAVLEAVRSAGFQDATEEVIWLALDQLDQAVLLQVLSDTSVSHINRVSRREVLHTLGKSAAIALPVVSTLNIKTAIAGLSCGSVGEQCITIACCSGLSCVGGQCQ